MPPKQKQETGELMVSIEQYTKTRDSVIVALSNLQGGLTHVQNGLNELLGAYMRHTTSILAGENGDLDQLQIPSTIAATASAAMEAATTAANGATQVINAANAATAAAADGKATKKRKREKKEKDPNAPKKPLTAAFLFHQHARPIVKADLEAALGPGEKVEKSAVQIEMNKRWHEMPEEDKEEWRKSYRASLVEWQEKMAEYSAKIGANPTDVHAEEEGSDDGEAEVEVEVGAIDSEAASEDDEEVPPTAKAPSPPAKPGRKRQKTAQASAVNGTSGPVPIAPASTSTPVPLPGARGAAQAAAPAAAPEAPAKKVTKKNAKAAPQAIAPAPAASSQLEASPEEQGGKKKAKGGRTTRNAEAEIDKENTVAATPAKKVQRDRSKRKSEAAA